MPGLNLPELATPSAFRLILRRFKCAEASNLFTQRDMKSNKERERERERESQFIREEQENNKERTDAPTLSLCSCIYTTMWTCFLLSQQGPVGWLPQPWGLPHTQSPARQCWSPLWWMQVSRTRNHPLLENPTQPRCEEVYGLREEKMIQDILREAVKRYNMKRLYKRSGYKRSS